MYNYQVFKQLAIVVSLFEYQCPHVIGVARKPGFVVSAQVRQKPGCTATYDGQKLDISDFRLAGGGGRSCTIYAADQHFCFRICKTPGFFVTRLILRAMILRFLLFRHLGDIAANVGWALQSDDTDFI